MASGAKKKLKQEMDALADMSKAREGAMQNAKRQIKTAARVAAIALVVIWLLAIGFYSGLDSAIPLYVAGVLTVAMAVAAAFIQRNLGRSDEISSLLQDGAELSDEERAARMEKLAARVEKGEAAAIIAKAQLQMQEEPKEALKTLEKVNLEKAMKVMANQVRGMRAMIHLNLGEVKAARGLADDVNLDKTPDLKARANLSGIVAEAWARSGNPIEATELLDKYDPSEKDMEEVKVQLLRARAFASAHRNKIDVMRRALKQLSEVSPQLMGLFVGQKRVHPLLQKEARKMLEKSGLMPRQRIQGARR